MRPYLCLLASSLLLASCVERSRGLTRTEREQLRQYVTDTPSTPQHELDISFEDKVLLIGYDIESENVAPGETITVTWHWRVDRALEDGWRLFTHVTDERGGNQLNEDDNGMIRQLYQPGQWKNGEYIRDRQQIVIPADWAGRRAVIYQGLWNGPNRLRVIRGANDGDNRARALTIDVGGAGAARPEQPAAELPSLEAKRAEGIQIDGTLDEPAWATAPWTDYFVDTLSGGDAEFRARAKTLWDDEHFYVAFEVGDDYLKTEFTEQDDHLWEADCVEIMVDPDGDQRNYFEMQVSPRNISFDTRYDTRRQPQPIGHDDWDSGLRSAVQVRGEIDDDDADQGYTVEIAIPWAAFDAGASPATKPSANDTWRVNFYVMDSREEGQRANGWSPPRVRDFHVPARFGRVRFTDPSAPTPAQPAQGAVVQPARPAIVPAALQKQLQQRLRETRDRNAAQEAAERPQPGERAPRNLPTAMTAMTATMAAAPMTATMTATMTAPMTAAMTE